MVRSEAEAQGTAAFICAISASRIRSISLGVSRARSYICGKYATGRSADAEAEPSLAIYLAVTP